MEIIPLMLVAVIILLTSFPAPTKVLGAGGGGGGGGGGAASRGGGGGGGGFVGSGEGSNGIGSGYKGGGGPPGTGYKGGGGDPFGSNPRDGSNVGSGYKGGASPQKPKIGGGDPGAAIVVIPKKPEPGKPKPPMPMPQECKPEVRRCINDHVYGTAGPPKYHGPCCVKLRYSVPCVCKFLSSPDPKLKRGANDLLGSCHYRKPKCGKISMPQECRPEVRHCVDAHLYGGFGQPQHNGACCTKFKTSKKCVCKFIKSIDPHLNKQANGVIRGCRFGKANCP